MTNMMKTFGAVLGFATLSACGGATTASTTPENGGAACACEHREGGEACACASHEGANHECNCGNHAVAAPAAALVAPGEAHVGDRTRCPVNGEEFTVTASSPHVEYNGKTYYLCCSHCIGTFQANPAQYTGGAATTPAAN
jgi:YHS domain-containing protein